MEIIKVSVRRPVRPFHFGRVLVSFVTQVKQFWSDRREKMKAYLASKKTAVAKDDEDETKRGGNKARGR